MIPAMILDNMTYIDTMLNLSSTPFPRRTDWIQAAMKMTTTMRSTY